MGINSRFRTPPRPVVAVWVLQCIGNAARSHHSQPVEDSVFRSDTPSLTDGESLFPGHVSSPIGEYFRVLSRGDLMNVVFIGNLVYRLSRSAGTKLTPNLPKDLR